MGGYPKGLLPAPSSDESMPAQQPGQKQQPLVVRLQHLAEQLTLRCVLVGESAAYRHLELPQLADSPPGIGPLGGLQALLQAANPAGALALSCDLPYVSRPLLALLLANVDANDGFDAVVPRCPGGPREPLCAYYAPSVAPVLVAAIEASERSFQALLLRLRVRELHLTSEQAQQLRDWDQRSDVPQALRPWSE